MIAACQLLCLALAAADLSAPAELTSLGDAPVVVARGGTVLPVVVDSEPANRWAAMFLADTIEETCGLRPRVYVVLPGQECSVSNGLFVGGRDGQGADRPTGDALRVEAADGSVRFGGRADYAVFDWCERFLGLRYYCAGGKCPVRREEIVVPSVRYSDAPTYDRRTLSGNPAWARVAKCGSTHRGGVCVHAPHAWFREPEVKAAHPEIFETGRTPMLCYGKPATRTYYCERIEREIGGKGDAGGIVDTTRKVVTVSQWDAPVRCACDWCRPLANAAAGDRGSASPILWGRFLPQLARWMKARHPDYLISFLPYLNTVEPVPAASCLAALGNCEAEVCTMPGLALLKDPATRAREEGLLRDWQRATGRKVLNWNYGCWPRDFTSAPYVFGRTVQRHLAAMTETVSGVLICGGTDDPSLALSIYVWMKCLWNPAIDVEAVYDGFASRMFGPAARPMRALIALQEECWEREWDSTDCTYRNVFEVSYPPADVARMKALLAEAWRLAADDGLSRERVGWYGGCFARFFREEEAAACAVRAGEVRMRSGEKREMILAREPDGRPWAKTTVELRPAREKDELSFVVRCEDPAAAGMDFSQIVDDHVWGDDCVTFVFEGLGKMQVFKDGSVKGGDAAVRGLTALPLPRVTHDRTGWTVTAAVKLPASAAHGIRGNVCRWRVGDMRRPEASRVAGSRYELSRLRTSFTSPDADPAAFVTFIP